MPIWDLLAVLSALVAFLFIKNEKLKNGNK